MSWDDEDFDAKPAPAEKLWSDEEETWEVKWDDTAPKKVEHNDPAKKLGDQSKGQEEAPKPPKPATKATPAKGSKKDPPPAVVEKELSTEERYNLKKEAEERVKAADFEHAKDLFAGVEPEKGKVAPTDDQNEILTKLDPNTVQDFNKLAGAIAARTKNFDESTHYPNFIKELCKQLTENLTSSDVAEVVKTLNIIVNEKIKTEKAPKKGMKKTAAKKKAAVTATRADTEEYDEFEETAEGAGGANYDDYLDFM